MARIAGVDIPREKRVDVSRRPQDRGRQEEVGVEDLMAQEKKTPETARKAPEAQSGAKKAADAQPGAERGREGAERGREGAERGEAGAEPKAAPRRRREKRVVPRGAAHVKASFNNTIV